jgi:hypothetical protein
LTGDFGRVKRGDFGILRNEIGGFVFAKNGDGPRMGGPAECEETVQEKVATKSPGEGVKQNV